MSVARRGGKWCIRYYGPDGLQRWETIGPNKKEAETVLHQRLYEVRSGIYPILRRRSRVTFAAFTAEWDKRHLPRVRASTADRCRTIIRYQLLPAFGKYLLSGVTEAVVQTWIADMVGVGTLAPRTINTVITVLKTILSAAVRWGALPQEPLEGVKLLRVPRRNLLLWTPAEIRRFIFTADEVWRSIWIVGAFSGLRPGEVQAMHWTEMNWPDFITNKIHVTCGYEAKSKKLDAPKTDRSVRDVDMVPAVRHVLEGLSSRQAEGLVFPRADGRMFSRSMMWEAWSRTLRAANVRRIRPYDLRHTYASLLIAAGKNPLYIARQMGHYSAGFTLDTYGHLMEQIPARPVEWIDELVFPEGLEAAVAAHRAAAREAGTSVYPSTEAYPALKLHLLGAPKGANPCNPVQEPDALEPLIDAAQRHIVPFSAMGCGDERGRYSYPPDAPPDARNPEVHKAPRDDS
jgi:integrase